MILHVARALTTLSENLFPLSRRLVIKQFLLNHEKFTFLKIPLRRKHSNHAEKAAAARARNLKFGNRYEF